MTDSPETLLHTPLHALHESQGARMVPFAGWSMPVQFPMGVKQEHLHTREAAGLFDVSHMGQLRLTGDNVAQALESVVPVDILSLPEGKQKYAILTNDQGGILDDLMITNYGDWFYLVVNAACREQDVAHLKAHLEPGVQVEELNDRALLALQGPRAVEVLAELEPAVQDMVFMDNWALTLDGALCYVSRSGYTGEDGYELSVPAADAERLAKRLLAHEAVAPIGLGARDSLRLEAGLCLYGHDMNTETTPAEASLIWAVSKPRRADGERPGGFPGADRVLDQIAQRNWSRKRVGLKAEGRAPVREGTRLFNEQDEPIGEVTSGTFGPSLGAPVAMAYVTADCSAPDTRVFAEVRGKRLPMLVTRMPFVAPGYHRG